MTDSTAQHPPDHPDRLREEAIQRVLRWKRGEKQRRREERRRRKYGRHGRRTLALELEEQ